MNIFDQILASGYYVFERQLNSSIIRYFISLVKYTGYKFQRGELKMHEIDKYMFFDNHMYKLKDGYDLNDIAMFIDFDMVLVFHNIKKSRDKYYSSLNGSSQNSIPLNNPIIKKK